jgi:predicted phosphodiesterase
LRIAVLSDIHGNLPALEAALDDARRQDADAYVDAGDITGGPQAQEAIRLLRSLNAWMIRGNNEEYLLAYHAGKGPESRRTARQWAPMRWSHQSLDGETLDFLASLPAQRVLYADAAAPIRIVHGSPRSASEIVFPDGDANAMRLFAEMALLPANRTPGTLDAILAGLDESVLICGHSHIQWAQERYGRLALNPGSVGSPFGDPGRAHYALLTWRDGRWRAEHRAVPYDLGRIRAAYRDSGHLAEGGAFARACLRGIETGRNVAWFFVLHAYGLAEEAGFKDCDTVPDDVWEQAAATFDWERGR